MLFPHASSATFMATILAFFLFLFFLLWILRKLQITSHKTILPPKAGGAWPLIGHLHLLRGPKPAHITLGNMADKYGSIFTIKLGVHRTLIVSSWEIAKECFTKNDKAFANRPKAIASELMGYNYALFILSPYGPYWRQVRKIATVEVLSNHRLEMLKHIRESEVNTSVKEIYELWVKNNNMLVEMKRWFGSITLNIIFRMVVGKRYFGTATSKDENDFSDKCRKTLKELFELSGTVVVADALPYLRWFDFGGYERAMKHTAKEFDHMIEGWIQEHKQRKVSREAKEPQDFMDVMLSVVANDEKISAYDADTITKATCLVTFRYTL
jgi:cytochrome P450